MRKGGLLEFDQHAVHKYQPLISAKVLLLFEIDVGSEVRFIWLFVVTVLRCFPLRILRVLRANLCARNLCSTHLVRHFKVYELRA